MRRGLIELGDPKLKAAHKSLKQRWDTNRRSKLEEIIFLFPSVCCLLSSRFCCDSNLFVLPAQRNYDAVLINAAILNDDDDDKKRQKISSINYYSTVSKYRPYLLIDSFGNNCKVAVFAIV